ncbi:hypothetical protein BGZ60DRAFT_558656 [Tricladium varicosporioides]|nr:hypothetical protein BGZ60DRAFT_558656 [Hymenoscyphus varicosporioides]
MTVSRTPTRLFSLPVELRRLIWEFTFEPQVIELRVRMVLKQKDGQPFPEYLTVQNFGNPAALSVCGESRDFALLNYRAWKIHNCDGKLGTIFWAPHIDVVYLPTPPLLPPSPSPSNFPSPPQGPPNPGRVFTIFEKQFPDDVKEVKRLAISTSLWPEGGHHNVSNIWGMIDFTSIKEVIVIFDKDFELGCARSGWRPPLNSRGVYGPSITPGPWTIPEDISGHIDFLRAHYEKFGPEYQPLGKKPAVRVVGGEARILSNDDERHVL